MSIERSYRGISKRLAKTYLESIGGEVTDEGVVRGEGWRASLSNSTVEVGPSIELTEVTVVFEGDEAVLEDVIEQFSQKAMRAGG